MRKLVEPSVSLNLATLQPNLPTAMVLLAPVKPVLARLQPIFVSSTVNGFVVADISSVIAGIMYVRVSCSDANANVGVK
jgi:hypothetical protein